MKDLVKMINFAGIVTLGYAIVFILLNLVFEDYVISYVDVYVLLGVFGGSFSTYYHLKRKGGKL